MKYALFSTPLELEPNQSRSHKQPCKVKMLGSTSNAVPKWWDVIKPKHWVWLDLPTSTKPEQTLFSCVFPLIGLHREWKASCSILGKRDAERGVLLPLETRSSAQIHCGCLLLGTHWDFSSCSGQSRSTEGLTPPLDVCGMRAAETHHSGCFHIQCSELVAAVQAEHSAASWSL